MKHKYVGMKENDNDLHIFAGAHCLWACNEIPLWQTFPQSGGLSVAKSGDLSDVNGLSI